MLRNDYRRALIMFRPLEQGYSGHARLERRTLMGTLCLTASAPGAAALRAALVGRRGNDYFAAPLGTMRRDSRLASRPERMSATMSTISSGWIIPTAIMPTVARLMEMRSTVPSSRRWA